jgi:hypothetical protein
MSKKHFEAIASALHQRVVFAQTEIDEGERLRDDERYESGLERRSELQAIAEALAGEFYRFNPRFDRSRFLSACGVSV